MNIYVNFNGIKNLDDARRFLQQTKNPCTLCIKSKFYRIYDMRVFELLEFGPACVEVELKSYNDAIKWIYNYRKVINEYMKA